MMRTSAVPGIQTRYRGSDREIIKNTTKDWKNISKRLEELTNIVAELVKRVSALEQVTSVLAEALVTRYVYEDIARETPFRSERTLKKFRNARSDELNINLMIESD